MRAMAWWFIVFMMMTDAFMAAEPDSAGIQPITLDLDLSRWQTGRDQGAALAVSKADTGLVLNYDFASGLAPLPAGRHGGPAGFLVQVYQNRNLDLSGHAAIKVVMSMTDPLNRIELKLVDGDGTNYGSRIENFPTDGQPHPVVTPVEKMVYFWGGDKQHDRRNIRSIWIAISRMSGGRGSRVIHSIEFLTEHEPSLPPAKLPLPVSEKQPKAGANPLTMDFPSAWRKSQDQGTILELSLTEGFDQGQAVKLAYDFVSGHWVQISIDRKMDISAFEKMSVWLKGKGCANRIEFKLVDADGSNFGFRIEDLARDRKWHRYRLPLEKIVYFWGGDDKLDRSHIVSFWIAVSEIEGFDGEISVDQIEFTK